MIAKFELFKNSLTGLSEIYPNIDFHDQYFHRIWNQPNTLDPVTKNMLEANNIPRIRLFGYNNQSFPNILFQTVSSDNPILSKKIVRFELYYLLIEDLLKYFLILNRPLNNLLNKVEFK